MTLRIWDAFAMNNIWKIEIQLRNEKHEVVDTVFVEQEFALTDRINQHLEPLFKPKLFDLGWQGFGLWASHVAIKPETTFAHINFLRMESKIVLQCENHNCQYRVITIPIQRSEKCQECSGVMDPKSFAMCGHNILCKACRQKATECPTCHYPLARLK